MHISGHLQSVAMLNVNNVHNFGIRFLTINYTGAIKPGVMGHGDILYNITSSFEQLYTTYTL